MTPQELKNSILQLAIQGKLVEQRPEEGTAEELFARIQAEKQRLIKAGKIKKEKPLPEITEEEKPFEIPESWMWCRLGSLCNIINGFTPSRSNPDFWNGDIPWFTIDDVREQGRFISYTNQYIADKAISRNSQRIIPPDTVLLCCTASVGEYAYTKIALTTNQQFNALVVRNENLSLVCSMYLYVFVQTLKSKIISGAGRTTFNFLSVGKLQQFLVPLPPLAEQKRIVAKTEELLPYIDRYAQAWSKLEQFNSRFPEDMKKSLLQYAIQGKLVEQRPEEGTAEELFAQIQAEKQRFIKAGKIKKEKPLPEITDDEKPFEIPESWMWVRLQQIGELSRGRSQKRPRNDPSLFVNGTFPFIQTGDVARANGHISHWTTMYNQDGVSQSRIWPSGTVCLTIAANIGDVAILDFDACFPDSVVGFNAYRPIISNEFFMYVLMCYKTILDKLSRSTAQKNINIEILSQIAFPLPPLAEQNRIVEKLEQLLPLCERLK